MTKKKNDSGFTRRDFLKRAAGAAVIGAGGSAIAGAGQDKPQTDQPGNAEEKTVKTGEPPAEKNRSRVVLVRNEKVLDESGKIDGALLEKMLDEGLTRLLGTPSSEKAWKKLFVPDDRVGIKSNVWRFLPTPAELEKALEERVVAAGVSPDHIGIDDRQVLRNDKFKDTTALINVRPLRTHHWSGVGSLIKNYIMFHPSPPSWHDDSCADLAGLWDLPLVKGKTRLNILVMLTPQFHGKGPHHFQAKYTWPYKGLIISRDPVAADAVGVRILEAKRSEYFGQDEPFSVPPKHIEVAEKKFKLGVADPERIELIKLGWDEDLLI